MKKLLVFLNENPLPTILISATITAIADRAGVDFLSSVLIGSIVGIFFQAIAVALVEKLDIKP